ncbi:MAG: hypothetical protein IPO92_00115 [Saprospiraceae bacterium]|nr:hypothetical protein [Saprospiraceae bacterium]
MTYQSQMTARLLPTHLHSHLLFCDPTDQPKKSKRECKQPHRDTANIDTTPLRTDRRAAEHTKISQPPNSKITKPISLGQSPPKSTTTNTSLSIAQMEGISHPSERSQAMAPAT